MMRLTIRAKLALFYATLLAVVLAAFGAVTYTVAHQRLDRAMDERVQVLETGLRGYVHLQDAPALAAEPRDPESAVFFRTAARFFQVYDAATGQLLAQSEESRLMDLALAPARVKQLVPYGGLDSIQTGRAQFRFRSSMVNAGDRSYLLRVGAPATEVEESRAKLLETIFLMVPAGIVIALVGGWWTARRALAPVEAIGRVAERIGVVNLHRRLPVRGTNDELDHLAATFNALFERLQHSVEQMRNFTAYVSHELRTPLTALKVGAELALLHDHNTDDLRTALTTQLEEIEKLSQVVGRLLILARADSGDVKMAHENVDISALAHHVALQLGPVAEAKGLHLHCDVAPALLVRGDQPWLERALLNVLDNAMKYTPCGGRVALSVAGGAEVVIRVADTGVGITAQDLPNIFEPFFRGANAGDPTRGAGLGLAMTRWIISAHCGDITVVSTPGQGSTFTLCLPRAPAADVCSAAAV